MLQHFEISLPCALPVEAASVSVQKCRHIYFGFVHIFKYKNVPQAESLFFITA